MEKDAILLYATCSEGLNMVMDRVAGAGVYVNQTFYSDLLTVSYPIQVSSLSFTSDTSCSKNLIRYTSKKGMRWSTFQGSDHLDMTERKKIEDLINFLCNSPAINKRHAKEIAIEIVRIDPNLTGEVLSNIYQNDEEKFNEILHPSTGLNAIHSQLLLVRFEDTPKSSWQKIEITSSYDGRSIRSSNAFINVVQTSKKKKSRFDGRLIRSSSNKNDTSSGSKKANIPKKPPIEDSLSHLS